MIVLTDPFWGGTLIMIKVNLLIVIIIITTNTTNNNDNNNNDNNDNNNENNNNNDQTGTPAAPLMPRHRETTRCEP